MLPTDIPYDSEGYTSLQELSNFYGCDWDTIDGLEGKFVPIEFKESYWEFSKATTLYFSFETGEVYQNKEMELIVGCGVDFSTKFKFVNSKVSLKEIYATY